MKNFSEPARIERPASRDLPALARLLRLAFGFDAERAREYLEHVGRDALWTLRDERGGPAVCAALIPTAHVFHGVATPAANIAHVAVAPEARGRGLAPPLVEALCAEARAQGAALVSLYASARPVYRKAGFELAGDEIVYECDTAALPTASDLAWREIDPADPALEAAYRDKAAAAAGLLRRAPAHWRELRRAPTHALAAYAAADGAQAAYALLDASDPDCLTLRDWHAASGPLAAALLGFLSRFRSVYPRLRWHGGPQDDLIDALPDKGWRIAWREEWLARVLDPAAALAARGYRPAAARLGLIVGGAPGVLLDIREGRAQVGDLADAEAPRIAVEAPAFASLFTGFRSATALARRGTLRGDAEALRTADIVFAGPSPWAAEHF